jgi:hypothetical protein
MKWRDSQVVALGEIALLQAVSIREAVEERYRTAMMYGEEPGFLNRTFLVRNLSSHEKSRWRDCLV